MTCDGIPDFLRLTAEQRAAAWRGRKLTTMTVREAKRSWSLPRTIDATGRAILRQQERDRAARAKARLEALRSDRRSDRR